MKKTLGLVALLAVGALTLAGCNKNAPVETPDENAEIANPASVYCEENGGTLVLEEGAGLCMFDDGSYCEEWAYQRGECQPGEIMYNTVEIGMPNPAAVYCGEQGGESVINEDEEGNQYGVCRFADGSEVDEWEYYRANNPAEGTSELYSQEDLAAAKAAIENRVNEWEVAIESFEVTYAGDETSTNNLEYCKNLNANVTECAVFTSSFHIPEQDVQMAGAFEPNADIEGWSWTLGKNAAGEWEVLSNGFG